MPDTVSSGFDPPLPSSSELMSRWFRFRGTCPLPLLLSPHLSPPPHMSLLFLISGVGVGFALHSPLSYIPSLLSSQDGIILNHCVCTYIRTYTYRHYHLYTYMTRSYIHVPQYVAVYDESAATGVFRAARELHSRRPTRQALRRNVLSSRLLVAMYYSPTEGRY